MPEGLPPSARRAVMAIRTGYADQLARYYAMRFDSRPAYLPAMYDAPAQRESVWYEMLIYAHARGFNPLWGVHLLVARAMRQNVPPNPWSLVSDESLSSYCRQGEILYNEAVSSVKSSLATLIQQVEPLQLMQSLTAGSAIDRVKQQTELNPVLELLWRDSRRVPTDTYLVTRARLEYACCPAVYGDSSYPVEWLTGRKLVSLFEVSNEPIVKPPAVNELLVNM